MEYKTNYRNNKVTVLTESDMFMGMGIPFIRETKRYALYALNFCHFVYWGHILYKLITYVFNPTPFPEYRA